MVKLFVFLYKFLLLILYLCCPYGSHYLHMTIEHLKHVKCAENIQYTPKF